METTKSLKRVLVVEDDHDIVGLIEIHLKDLGCELEKAYHGDDGLKYALDRKYDLIVLDLMLPGMDGLEICRRIRARDNNTPILMLTAKSEEIDKVLGLEMGADDYITKPFSVREFVARVKAIFRRIKMMQHDTPGAKGALLKYGDLTIDLDKRKVSLSEKRIDLSPKEFELLALLASNPGKSYNRSQILRLIWGYDFDGYEHTVNSHINRLRRKVEPDLQNPTYILTSWGVGYRFSEDVS